MAYNNWCWCGAKLKTNNERRAGMCRECELEEVERKEWDRRFECANCGQRCIMIPVNSSVNFCSDKCEEKFHETLLDV